MCSFDICICSLFTNVPLEETIHKCAEALYNNPDFQPYFPKEISLELMLSATSTVEFSFDKIIYKQIDGVAMGSPHSPVLANILIGYHEEKLFLEITKPAVYFRYDDDDRCDDDDDDSFALFQSEKEYTSFSQIHFWERRE